MFQYLRAFGRFSCLVLPAPAIAHVTFGTTTASDVDWNVRDRGPLE